MCALMAEHPLPFRENPSPMLGFPYLHDGGVGRASRETILAPRCRPCLGNRHGIVGSHVCATVVGLRCVGAFLFWTKPIEGTVCHV